MTVADHAYGKLLATELPHAIHTPEEYDHYLELVAQLVRRNDRSEPETRFLELLSVLIEGYEEENEQIDAPDPIAALKELMAANNMTQADLGRLFKSSGTTSMILSGQRQLSKAQIKLLSQRFNVSADLFI